jgi:hypothetical protein
VTTACLFAVAACSSEKVTGLTLGGMTGNWTAVEYLFVDAAENSSTHNALAGYSSIAMVFQANDTVRIEMRSLSGGVTTIEYTALVEQGDTLRLTSTQSGIYSYYHVAFRGTDMTWSSRRIFAFDMDADGIDESVFERIRWRRE